MELILVAPDRYQWRAVVDVILKVRVQRDAEYLASQERCWSWLLSKTVFLSISRKIPE